VRFRSNVTVPFLSTARSIRSFALPSMRSCSRRSAAGFSLAAQSKPAASRYPAWRGSCTLSVRPNIPFTTFRGAKGRAAPIWLASICRSNSGSPWQRGVGRRGSKHRHDWLLLVPHDHPYRQFISDLAGYDPTEHDGTPGGIVPAVMSWLATRPDAVQCPTPREVLESLADFYTAAKALGDRWHGQAPWADLVLEAIRVGRERGLIPAADT
jgi:hypothetical protein